ncbi:hypothetical protein CDN99_13615 [Roseateles aquatilis]|uniref:Uncharacterized protein n=1 Tax=Roseateles aquatilis TaxID=431061 RepID=A0A246JD11_9BURK|nr:hypothetical protein [Roseateles aquatilis]OWQ90387.1 hypothetical protein CDN99_13615 [Roseateles aquatilis]
MVLALVSTGEHAWRSSEPSERVLPPASSTSPETASPGASESHLTTPRAAVRVQTTATAMTEAMSSSNPYALAIKLRNDKAPGSFAVALEIRNVCLDAYANGIAVQPFLQGLQTAPRGRGMPVGNTVSADIQAMRTAARQAIEARCRPFLDDRSTGVPLSDDPFGISYEGVHERLIFWSVAKTSFADPLPQFLAQGLLWRAWEMLGSSEDATPYFEGQVRGGLTAQEFRRAVELGSVLATSAGAGPSDLRSLAACVYSALCDSDPAQLVLIDLPADSPSVPRIKALGTRIAAALAANDIQAFMPPR